MALSNKDKIYIKRNIRKFSVDEVAQELQISQKDVSKYLKKIWKPEKYNKILISKSIEPDFSQRGLWTILAKSKYIFVLIVFLVFISYINGINSEFVSDDIGAILNNPNLYEAKSLFGSLTAFTYSTIRYFTALIFRFNPFGYRMVNILFHLIASFGVYLLFYISKNQKIGIFVASIFAVHPIMAESITWISGGGYVISGAFSIACLLMYFLSRRSNAIKKYYFLSIFFYLLALTSLEKSAVLFLGILWIEFVFYTFSVKNLIKRLTPFFLISLLTIFFTLSLFSRRIYGLVSANYQPAGVDNPFIQVPIAITEYLKLIFWPKDLTLYHSEMVFSQQEYLIRLVIFLIFIGAIIYSYWRIRGRNPELMIKFWKTHSILTSEVETYRFIFFWLLFFLISLSATLTPFRVSWIVAERYVYLGSVGIFAIVGLLFYKLSEIKSLRTITYSVFILMIVALSIRTIIRNRDWRNEDTLWIATAKTSPSSPNTHNNLGDVYSRHGDLESAAKEFKIATEINPRYADAYHNLANTYQQMAYIASQNKDGLAYGKTKAEWLQEAVNTYGLAIKYNPNLWQSYQNLGIIFYSNKQYDYALEYFDKAINVNPYNEALQHNRALIKSEMENSNLVPR